MKRTNIPSQQQQMVTNNQYESYPNSSNNNSQFPFYPQYYYPPHGYQYPVSMTPHHRVWTQPYSDDRSQVYSNFHYHPNNQQQQQQNSNRLFYSNNQRRKCFQCGSPNHLKAQCSQFQTNIVHR
jgi:hypothetical protein